MTAQIPSCNQKDYNITIMMTENSPIADAIIISLHQLKIYSVHSNITITKLHKLNCQKETLTEEATIREDFSDNSA